MRIAIDALGINNFGGGRSATMALLKGLFSIDRHNQYFIYLSQIEPALSVYNTNIHQLVLPYRNRFIQRIVVQLFLLAQAGKFDLIHFSKNLCVSGLRVPYVVTIYDMTTLIHPGLFPKFDVWYWKTLEKKHLQAASRVIAISATTAHDIEQIYHLSTEKIKVIYPSIDPQFSPAPAERVSRILIKYHLPESYILHVGRIDQKKKLTLLVEAYAQAKSSLHDTPLERLVLVGQVYQKSQDQALLPTIERLGLNNDILFIGAVPEDDLPAIITGAKAAISTSIHEGFGLSAVEALACGTPLIAYSAGALQEAVGESAYLLKELNKECIAEALIKINQDPLLRSDLRQRGLLWSQRYQGDQNARQTLQLYEEIANEKH